MNDLVPPPLRPKAPPDVVNLEGFPLPPSVNNLYLTIGKRRVKAGDYRLFERAVMVWMKRNAEALDYARQLTILTGPKRFIHIDTMFYMKRERIFCKDGRPKRNDTSNRIKALHDALATILGLDDCYFWSGGYDKQAVDDDQKVGVSITMVISPYEERDCSSPRL